MHPWFKPRGYRHFDVPVGIPFTEKASNPEFVARHSWLPLIRYIKSTKRYKPRDGKTKYKNRPIMFASHRDACILSKYAFDLSRQLEAEYSASCLNDNVIAYRRLGKSNYHFAATAFRFAQAHAPCVVLCFDITGFFDHLDHRVLKRLLKRVLGVSELSDDWYGVFRHVTKYSAISRDDLAANPRFSKALARGSRGPIATIDEVLAAGIKITKNPDPYGIPQGTPISSPLSNLYMLDIDIRMARACEAAGGLYQRYCDDILVICPADQEATLTGELKAAIGEHLLDINDDKTERALFDGRSDEVFQYLGFNMSRNGAALRPSSLARQWRKAKRAIRTTKRNGDIAIAAGLASKIYTKRLRRRFAPIGVRNFSKYARRAADALASRLIVKQAVRLERMVDRAIRGFAED